MNGNPPVTSTQTLYFSNINDITGAQGAVGPMEIGFRSTVGGHPYQTSMSVSLGIHRNLGFNTVLDVSYVGNFGRHLDVDSRDKPNSDVVTL